MALEKLKKQEYWDNEWEKIFTHYQQDVRHAYYINAILKDDENKILEIAAGSFRDFAKLNELGKECYAFDYSLKSVEEAKKYYPNLKDKITQQNAFKTSYKDKEFDLSYHNGFWGCFDNEEIFELAKEQIRITKSRIVFSLHNAHNKNFVEYFKKLSANDDLYKLRFFHVEEAKELVKGLVKNVQIIPVGKGKKYYEDDLINLGFHDAKYIKKSFDYHQMNLLETSERLLCIGEL